MDLVDAFWHFCNLLAPAVGLGVLVAVWAKWVWARALRGVSLRRLVQVAVVAALAGLLLGLLWTGRDGRMLGHALTLLGAALGLWWVGFVRRA